MTRKTVLVVNAEPKVEEMLENSLEDWTIQHASDNRAVLALAPEPERTEVATAFREMLLNAIEHGGRFNPEQYVEISYLRARRMVMCRVKDPGEGFELDEIRHAAFANPPGEPLRHLVYRDIQGLRPGGFGVMVARHLVDELIYSEQGNDVVLVKYLDQGRQQTA